ncbi:phage tail tape measure protein [Limosilactobacillus reuteri]|uniref:phage tail tape measure protein n=1 Tax=Limosilactobacillus reuteri TaxID=1598 RepID=UPI000A1FE871|nr:phage tail tape measure protein [Limosilactobacillus reuteri]
MAEQLSIKVKVDLPSAGEIESQLNKELRGMKDIETNVKVKPKVTGLKGLKSEIRKSLNGDKFKANVGVKVTGEAKLAKLAREMEKVRRLANEPIRFSVDAGNSKFDEQVSKAKKGIEDLNKSYTKGAGLGLRKQVEEARRNMEQTYAAMRKNNLDATKANNDRVAQVYKESAAQNKAQLQKDIAEYRRLSEDAGIGRKDINKQIRRSTTPSIKAETAQRLAQTRREISAAKRDWQDYGRIMKEAYSTEQKMAKGTAGRNETRALRERAAALRSEAEAIKLIPEYQERANRAERAQQRNLSMINAKRLDGAYASNARRTRTRGGIVPTMDISSALMTGAMGIAGIIEQYNAVDKAITKVTKVVPDSQRAVNRWRKNIYKDAAEVGKSAPEFASAVEQWATAGYNLKQSNRLAKQSVMGAFVGEVPVNDMVKYMSVPMKAFQKEGIKSTDIINAMNQVSNKHAIEMDDLGQAYQKASSTVGATGTKFSQLTGIITAAQEGTRAGGDAIGTAYKTIGSRIAKMGTGLTKQDQTRAAFFKGLGVNLTDTNGKLKSTWDVMDQLGKKWDTLSEKDKNTAAQYAAGANHANIFQATMDNWKTARQAMREAEAQQGLGSSGSAYQEMAKQKQSVEFQLKGLQDMWGQFVENITGGRKGIGDMLNVVSFLGNGLTKLSANPFLSSAVRWGTVAAGMVMARKAMVSLAGGLGSVIMQGKKGDSVLERLTGISSKTQKMKDKWTDLKNAVDDVRGKTPSGKRAKTQTEQSIEELRNHSGKEYSTETEELKKNTAEHERNSEARKQNGRSMQENTAETRNNIQALGGANTQLEASTKKTNGLTEKTGKLGKVARVAKAGIGVLGAGLGYVGLALDAVTIAGMAMNAMGIHPITAMKRAMDPAGESARILNKHLDKTGKVIESNNAAIEKNGFVTGQMQANMKTVADMKTNFASLQRDDKGNIADDDFQQIKQAYNKVAKDSGLEFRMGNNQNADVVQNKINALNDWMPQVQRRTINEAATKAQSNMDQINDILSNGNISKLISSTKGYQGEMSKLERDLQLQRNGIKTQKDYDRAKQRIEDSNEYRFGDKNDEMWSSKAGKRAAAQVKAAQGALRDVYRAFGDGLTDGTLTKDNIAAMSEKEKHMAAMGAVTNLRDLKGVDRNNESVKAAQANLNMVFSSLGKNISQKLKNSITDAALAGDNGSLMKGLRKAGLGTQEIAAMAGIGAQYQQQYRHRKGGFIGQAAADETSAYKFRDSAEKRGIRVGNVDAIMTENGFLDYEKLAKFNASNVNTATGKRAFNSSGIKYGSHMSVPDMLRLTTGIDGDPTKVLTDFVKGGNNTNATNVATITNNAQRYKIDKDGNLQITGRQATGEAIGAAVAAKQGNRVKSKDTMKSGIDDAAANGSITREQADKANDWIDKNFNSKGQAKTVDGFVKATQDLKQMTKNQFKNNTKGLSNKERQEALKQAQKNGQITSEQAKALSGWTHEKGNKNKTDGTKVSKPKKSEKDGSDDKDSGSKPKKKKNSSKSKDDDNDKSKPRSKSKSKTAKDIEKQIGKDKISNDELKSLQKGLKNSKERQKLAYDLNRKNQVKTPWQDKLKDFLSPEMVAKASTRNGRNNFKMPNLSKLNPFKGFKMPSLNKLNPFKGFKMPKLNLPKGLTTNPFKNWKMPKGITSPLKNLKLPKNMNNPFKNWKMPKGLGNMFKGNNPFKGIQNSFNKLFGGKGKNNKIKVDADTKAAEQKVKKLGKGSGKNKTKVKVDADTKGAESKIKKLGKSKNSKAKIKVDADTKGVQSKLKNIGKNSKAKVKVNADTKSAESKVKNIGKNAKAKVKVDADTGNAKSKINSLKSSLRGLNSGKHSIHVSVAVSGEGKVKALKSAISGLSNKSVSINASVSGDGKVKSLKSAIASVSNKSVTVSASVSGTGKVRQLKSAIDGVQSKHVSVTAKVSGTGEVRALASAIASVRSKSVTVSATKIETTIKKTKSGSVGITPENVSQPANPLRSMSVVAGNPQLAGMIGTSAQSMGLASDVNSAMNGQKVTDYSDSTQKVSEDYWRYMGNELYTGLPLDEQVNKLEGAVTQADDNMDKLIDLARQRIDLDNKQIAYQKTMQNAYQQQITDMINELHKYGFQNNGNQITNLNHAKDITGDNASKVDDLLSKYQSAYQNFSQATQKIQELQTDIWQQGKNQDDYRNTKDQKMVEKLQRELELLNTSIDNQKNILDRENDSLTDSDYRMKLKNSSDQIYSKSDAVQQLLAEFNKLSLTNFVGTKDADNAKNLADSLSSIKESIMDNLDAIDELKKSIRDIKINALIDNVDKITDNLSNSVDRLKNNVTNLQDGLLSGTTYSDLVSSDLDVVNLNQKGAYEKGVNDKIQLERELDNVLDQFAKKNVDRTAQVANEQLQIESQKYDQMLSMATSYARGTRWESSKIQPNYNATTESDQIEVSGITHNQEYVKASIEYQKQLNDLKARYNEQMANADSAETKQLINQRLVYEQLMLQEKVYGTMIETDKQAIAELRKQFNDPDMNSEQLKTISDKITEYENNIMDAQNNIKEAVKSRYDYEKTLLDKEIDDYQRLSDTMSNLVTIADALHLNGETQASIINQQYEATYLQYNNYLDILARLREERSKFEKGSYEWNQLNSMIQEYQPSLESIVTSLLEVNKNEFEQKLSSVQEYFEKNVNEGKTADQAKFDQDVWYNPVQKELRLEEMRLKIVELEDKTVEKRIAALDAQERMSKAEADYVDKQLDLALAEQKLNNTINKKDVRYLEKDENGKFNWTYIADQDQVDAARQEVNKAKQEIEDAKISNRNDYIEKVEKIVSDIKDGAYDQSEARSRLEQLNNSYKFILKDIPTFDISKVEDILKAYNDYEQRNKDIMNDYRRNDNISNKAGYKEIIDGFGEQFKMVSKDLGEIFGKQLHDALSLPNGIRNAYGNGTDNSLTINGDLKVELPDVTNVDEFAKAIATLPQVARQKATSK